MSNKSSNRKTIFTPIPETSPLEKPGHSRMGISSFVISILSGVSILALFYIAAYVDATTLGGIDAKPSIAFFIGLGFLIISFLTITAIGLAIAGLFQKNKLKLYSILGLLFSLVNFIPAIDVITRGMISHLWQ